MDWLSKKDEEMEDDFFIDAQFMAGSRREALDLTGDDSFYPGVDDFDDEDDEYGDEDY